MTTILEQPRFETGTALAAPAPLIPRETASHWYLRSGEPYHYVRKADGGLRPTRLADARKVGALPSVTTILNTLARPALEAWKVGQAIQAAITLPRIPGESDADFTERVKAQAADPSKQASDFGSAIHQACQNYALTGQLPADGKWTPFLEDWQRWFDEQVSEVRAVERVYVHLGMGYAGCVDLVARLQDSGWAIIDFKTQKVKRDARGQVKPEFYDTWPLQLAAYQQAVQQTEPRAIGNLVSVVIDSVEPGPVQVKYWEREGMEYFGLFMAANELWRYTKAYDPTTVGLPVTEPGRN